MRNITRRDRAQAQLAWFASRPFTAAMEYEAAAAQRDGRDPKAVTIGEREDRGD
ncbi:MAG: hypothetical protein OXH09_18115 [Gammaproteobacteria bacterium]|nr:hypothetical protein [Gammaproteobacteria bacterium]